MSYNEELLLKVPADYDVNKIGFILLLEDSPNNSKAGAMEIDYELTPIYLEPSSGSNLKCHICSRIYINRSNLRRHLNTVHSGKLFECGECQLKFENARKLTFHMKVHKKNDAFICDHCGRQEITRNEMEQHLEIHIQLDIDIDEMLLDF